MIERSTRILRIAALGLTVAAIGETSCTAPPKKGPDRFVGTFRWQQDFGSQAIAFEKGGKAKYITVLPGNGDSSETKGMPSTYTVSGDTALLVVDWGDPNTANTPLTMLLRGDSLIMLDEVLGGHPVFMRER